MTDGFIKTLYNSSIWCKVVLVFAIVIAYYLINKTPTTVEGFIQKQKFLLKQGKEVYDPFYASVYDDLIYDRVRNEYEVGQIIQSTRPTHESLILDVGSGTGDNVAAFVNKGYNAVGLDLSPPMVTVAKQKYPGMEFSVGNAEEVMMYPAHTFTHITCMHYTIYEIKNKFLFFRNCYEWLRPGGYLTVHMVDNNEMSPNTKINILSNANTIRQGKGRTYLRFNNFKYRSKFSIENALGIFEEIFTDLNGKIRKNIHRFDMPSQNKIINLAQEAGFILEGKIDLLPANYENQYIYIFYKPD